MGFDPKISPNAFKCFWSCGTGWGVFRRQNGKVELEVLDGELELKELALPFIREAREAALEGAAIAFRFEDGALKLNAAVKIAAGQTLVIR